MSCHLGHHQQWGKLLLRSRGLASFRFWIQYRALDIDKPQREWNEGMSFKLLLQLPNLIVFGQQQAQVYQTYAQWGELWCALKRKKEKGEKWASQTKEGQQNKCWNVIKNKMSLIFAVQSVCSIVFTQKCITAASTNVTTTIITTTTSEGQKVWPWSTLQSADQELISTHWGTSKKMVVNTWRGWGLKKRKWLHWRFKWRRRWVCVCDCGGEIKISRHFKSRSLSITQPLLNKHTPECVCVVLSSGEN